MVACFNGATTFQPWRLWKGDAGIKIFIKFQWSHDFSAMETPLAMLSEPKCSAFQWSHDFSAMETVGLLHIDKIV